MSNVSSGNPNEARFPYPLSYDGSPEGVLDAPLGHICRSLTGSITYKKTTGLGLKTGWVQASPDDLATVGAQNARTKVTAVFAITGVALHAAANGILNALVLPAAAIVTRAILDITTQSTGACTLDIGYSATTLTTSDTMLDGVSAAAVALFDSMNAALDTGTNAFAQKAASGKYITVDEKTGDATGLVANLYIEYFVA